MATVDLVMPKMGESIMEATILKWHKNPGDLVKMDETILEIATDKVDSEVPSTAEGTIAEIWFNVNVVVPIRTVIARIKTGVGSQESGISPQPVVAEANGNRETASQQSSAISQQSSVGSQPQTTNHKQPSVA